MPTDTREELAGSPVENRAGFEFSATRKWLCEWDDRYYVRGLLNDWPGEQYPYATLFDARCRSVAIEGFGQQTVDSVGPPLLVRYAKALITAEYSTPRYSDPQTDPDDPDEIVSESFEPFVQYLTFERRDLRWYTPTRTDPDGDYSYTGPYVNEALKADEAPGIIETGLNYKLTRHSIESIPQAVLDISGHINEAELRTRFTGGTRITFGAEQLLFVRPSIERAVLSTGVQKLSLSMDFIFRNIPTWNRFFRARLYNPSSSSDLWYDKIAIKDKDGNDRVLKPYPVSDFTPLISGV